MPLKVLALSNALTLATEIKHYQIQLTQKLENQNLLLPPHIHHINHMMNTLVNIVWGNIKDMSHLKTALKILTCDPSELDKIPQKDFNDIETVHFVQIVSHFIELSQYIDQEEGIFEKIAKLLVKPGSETLAKTTEALPEKNARQAHMRSQSDKTVGIVMTAHPSTASPTQIFVNTKFIVKALRDNAPGKLKEAIQMLIKQDPIFYQPQLEDEINAALLEADGILDVIEQVAPLLSSEDLNQILLQLHEWTAFEADRNRNTPESMIKASMENRDHIIARHIQNLKQLQTILGQDHATAPLVQKMRKALEQSNGESVKHVMTCVKLQAAYRIVRGSDFSQNPDGIVPKDTSLDYNQFHFFLKEGTTVMNPREIREWMIETLKGLGLPTSIDQIMQDVPSTGLFSQIRTRLTQAINSLKPAAGLEQLYTQLATQLEDGHLEVPVQAQIKRCVATWKVTGLHLYQGQGRLDVKHSRQIMRQALGLLTGKLTGTTTNRLSKDPLTDEETAQLMSAIQNGTFQKLDFEAPPFDYNDASVLDFYGTIQQLNNQNPDAVSYMIGANYEGANDFIVMFAMATKAGAVLVEDGKVSDSHIRIMPLLESLTDHRNASSEFEKLFQYPLAKSYFEHMGYVYLMKAFSDTLRDGGPEAVQGVMMSHQLVLNAMKKHLPGIKLKEELGIGSHPMRCGGPDTDQTWHDQKSLAETINGALKTFQPPESRQFIYAPENMLGRFLSQAQSRPDDAEHEQATVATQNALTEAYLYFMDTFIQPGFENYQHALLNTRDSKINTAIHESHIGQAHQETLWGSRAKAPSKVANQLDEAYTKLKRAIFMASLWSNFGYFIPVLESSLVSLEAFIITCESLIDTLITVIQEVNPTYQDPRKIAEEQVKYQENPLLYLHDLYRHHPIFKTYIQKIAGLVLESDLEQFQLALDPSIQENQTLISRYKEEDNKIRKHLSWIVTGKADGEIVEDPESRRQIRLRQSLNKTRNYGLNRAMKDLKFKPSTRQDIVRVHPKDKDKEFTTLSPEIQIRRLTNLWNQVGTLRVRG